MPRCGCGMRMRGGRPWGPPTERMRILRDTYETGSTSRVMTRARAARLSRLASVPTGECETLEGSRLPDEAGPSRFSWGCGPSALGTSVFPSTCAVDRERVMGDSDDMMGPYSPSESDPTEEETEIHVIPETVVPAPAEDKDGDCVIVEKITDSLEVIMVEDYISISSDSRHSMTPDRRGASPMVYGGSVLDAPPAPVWEGFQYQPSPATSPLLPSLSTPPYASLFTLMRESPPPMEFDSEAFMQDGPSGHVSAMDEWEPFCFTCGQFGHYPGDCRHYQPYAPSGIVCLTCGGEGHYTTSCPVSHRGAFDDGSSFFSGAQSSNPTSFCPTLSTCTSSAEIFPGCRAPGARWVVPRGRHRQR